MAALFLIHYEPSEYLCLHKNIHLVIMHKKWKLFSWFWFLVLKYLFW